MPDRTHAQMARIIQQGGSIMLNPSAQAQLSAAVVDQSANLPTAVALALQSGDAAAKQAARAASVARLESIRLELEAMDHADAADLERATSLEKLKVEAEKRDAALPGNDPKPPAPKGKV